MTAADVASTLQAQGKTGGYRIDAEGTDNLVVAADVSPPVTAKWAKGSGGPAGDEAQNLVVGALTSSVGDLDDQDTTRLVTQKMLTEGGKPGEEVWYLTDHTPALGTTGGKAGQGQQVLVEEVTTFRKATKSPDDELERWEEDDAAGTLNLTEMGLPGSTAVAFSIVPEGGQGADLRATEVDTAPALAAITQGKGTDRGVRVVDSAALVRRLTPTECERLMGWPDGWTAPVGVRAPDSRRYAACGDGVVANVAEWIGRRIVAVNAERPAEAGRSEQGG